MPDARTTDRTRALARFRWVGLALPLALTAVVVVVQLVLLPRLPDPVASHWGLSGEPDGWSAPWTYPLMTALVCGGIVLLTALGSLAGSSRSGSLDFRFVSAINLWTVGFLGSLLLHTVWIQVDLTDTSGVRLSGWALLPSLAFAFALGAAGWFLTLRVPADDADTTRPDAVALRPGEQAVWLRTTTMARAGMVLLAATILGTVGPGVFFLFTGESEVGWILVGTAVFLGILALAMTAFRIRVDATGFTARSTLGWPRVHIPTAEIATVEVLPVNPMGDFGGWGWRVSPTMGQGIVTRSGDAVRITRTNGKRFTVTVDDAAMAAALLRGYQERTSA